MVVNSPNPPTGEILLLYGDERTQQSTNSAARSFWHFFRQRSNLIIQLEHSDLSALVQITNV